MHNDQRKSKEYKIPPNLVRSVDAVVDDTGEHVYLREAKSDPAKIYHYQISRNKWEQPVWSLSTRWSMVYYKNLILVGGLDKPTSMPQRDSDLVGVHSNDDGTLRPESIFPNTRLPNPRCRTTALVYTDPKNGVSYIIIIGGEDEKETFLTTVHILETTSTLLRWCQGKDIPEPLSCSSGAIANGHLYLLGGWYKRDKATSSVYRCNVDALIETRQIVIPFKFQGQK